MERIMAPTASNLLAALTSAGSDNQQAVLDAIELVKKYMYIVGYERGITKAPAPGLTAVPLPTVEEVRQLIDGLMWHCARHRIDTLPLQHWLQRERSWLRIEDGPFYSGRKLPSVRPTQEEWFATLADADGKLNELKIALTTHGEQVDSPPPEWQGDDWERLEPLVRRLLLHMHRQDSAEIGDVYEEVWGKTYDPAKRSAVHTAVSKANNFLLRRASKRNLHVPRGKAFICWDKPLTE
jgi:hypothetical protein